MSEPQAGERATMWAVRLHEYGGPEVLRYERVERPEPGPGEVRVRVAASGVNPVDWKTREGGGVAKRNPLPLIVGWDIAGDVEALGAGVTDFAVGDPVFGLIRFPLAGGGYAEHATAPVAELARRPAKLAPEAAAAAPLAALTAWQGLFDAGHLAKGQTVLVHAAAGGVGHLAVQIAKWAGARVVGTASQANSAFVHSLGADAVIDYQAAPFEKQLHGCHVEIDLVFDAVGGDTHARSYDVVRPGGRLITIAAAPDAAAAERRGIHVQQIFVHPDGAQLGRIAALLDSGALRVEVSHVLPLADAARAQELSRTSRTRGKIVLRPA